MRLRGCGMKYPFSPEYLDALPEGLVDTFREIEIELITEICTELKRAGEANSVVTGDIRQLRSFGIDEKDIEAVILKMTGIGRDKLKALFDEAVKKNEAYYSSFDGLTMPQHIVGLAEIEHIRQQTLGAFDNISRSMAFVVDGEVTEPAKAFRKAIDKAIVKMQTGEVSYNEAIKSAVRELADSGLMLDDDGNGQYVTYGEGKRHISVPVAVRRAVMTGITQLSDKYTQDSAEYLGTRYFEVSAHAGARDKGDGWDNHKNWQGKVYYQSEHGEPDPLGEYRDLHDVTGFGEVDGLEGVNCRHRRFVFVPGLSERTWTDEKLEHIDDGLGCEFEGRKYSAYEATQKQREIESTIRKWEKRQAAFKAAGLDKELQNANIRLTRLRDLYRRFSKAAGLKEQWERVKV